MNKRITQNWVIVLQNTDNIKYQIFDESDIIYKENPPGYQKLLKVIFKLVKTKYAVPFASALFSKFAWFYSGATNVQTTHRVGRRK